MNESVQTEGWLDARGDELRPPAPQYMLIHRWQINQWPVQDKAYIQTSKCRSKGKITMSNLTPKPQLAPLSFVHYALKRFPPIRNTCSSGSRSPSGLPSRRSDVSATPELITPPGFHGSPFFLIYWDGGAGTDAAWVERIFVRTLKTPLARAA